MNAQVARPVAQGASVAGEPTEDEARTAFREGSEAAAQERWADSERAFRRAYDLSHAPSALFNRAVALRALGRHLEARDAFDQLLGADDPQITPDLRKSAGDLRAESASSVAAVTLTGLTLSPHRIRVDGKPVRDSMARPLTFELDQGAHSIEVVLERHETWQRSEELAPGERLSIAVALTPSQKTSSTAPRNRHQYLFWIGGAAAIVLAGSVTATALVLSKRDQQEPISPRASSVFEVP